MKKYAVLIFCLCVSGCWFQKWQSDNYVVKNAPPRGYQGAATEFPSFSVNGAVIKVFFRATNEGLYSGEAPFEINVSAWGGSSQEHMSVKSINLLDSNMNIIPMANGDVIHDKTPFSLCSGGTEIFWSVYSGKHEYNIEAAIHSMVYVELVVEVMCKGRAEERTLRYEFYLNHTSGNFKFITV